MALYRPIPSSQGGTIKSFTPTGASGSTWGTNFSIGKKYLIVATSTGAGGASISSGANIDHRDEFALGSTSTTAFIVCTATANTIVATKSASHIIYELDSIEFI